MKILMVTAEAAPFIKTGGLADVLGSLPAAVAKLGDQVGVVLPRYRAASVEGAERIWNSLPLWVGPHTWFASVDRVMRDGVAYYLIDCPLLYDRDLIYGEPDDHLRFAALTQAALGVARFIFRPDVFHAHDWHAGLLAPLLKTRFANDPVFLNTRSVFTIHNLGYQGNFPLSVRPDLGLPPSLANPGALEFWEQLSYMKGGILFSDAVTTVSPTYAQEIQTPEFGFGMDGVLRGRAANLTGILNGVDYAEWSPEVDPFLVRNYSSEDLAGKLASKRALLAEMQLAVDEAALQRPLIGIVSRFAGQKGFDLVAGLADWLPDQDISLAVLGSGEPQYEAIFRDLAARRPDRFAVRVGYDNGLAHRIEAGADLFLMPSRYEPCGLNQIYSLRYGTVPVVRATGGLADTVTPQTGFRFDDYTPAALAAAIKEALAAYANPITWRARMRRGMHEDFSWDASAKHYQSLYNSLWDAH